MKVTLTTHGGQAAAIHLRTPARVVQTDALPDAVADELSKLVAAAMSETPAADYSRGRARDAMSYTVTVEHGGRSSVLSRSDTNMTQSFAALLNWLEEHAAAR